MQKLLHLSGRRGIEEISIWIFNMGFNEKHEFILLVLTIFYGFCLHFLDFLNVNFETLSFHVC